MSTIEFEHNGVRYYYVCETKMLGKVAPDQAEAAEATQALIDELLRRLDAAENTEKRTPQQHSKLTDQELCDIWNNFCKDPITTFSHGRISVVDDRPNTCSALRIMRAVEAAVMQRMPAPQHAPETLDERAVALREAMQDSSPYGRGPEWNSIPEFTKNEYRNAANMTLYWEKSAVDKATAELQREYDERAAAHEGDLEMNQAEIATLRARVQELETKPAPSGTFDVTASYEKHCPSGHWRWHEIMSQQQQIITAIAADAEAHGAAVERAKWVKSWNDAPEATRRERYAFIKGCDKTYQALKKNGLFGAAEWLLNSEKFNWRMEAEKYYPLPEEKP